MFAKSWVFPALVWTCSLISAVAQQRNPQDQWFVDRTWGSSGTGPGQFFTPTGMAIGPNGRLYVIDSGRVQVFEQDGTFVQQWTSATGARLAIASNGEVYVGGTAIIRVYSATGTFLRQWGTAGTGQGQFTGIVSVAINAAGEVFAGNTTRVQVFQSSGTFVRQFGVAGSLPGQLIGIRQIAIGPDGLVAVGDADNVSGNEARRIRIYEQSGTFLYEWGATLSVIHCLTIGPDGNVFLGNFGQFGGMTVLRPDGTIVRQWGFEPATSSGNSPTGIAVNPAGDIFATAQGVVRVFARGFRSGRSTSFPRPPQPFVLRAEQRPATAILDLDFRVVDADSATVEAYPLAFADGTKSLASVIPVTTLVEGTAANTGAAVATNTTHRLSWNAAADWAASFGQVKVEILANDGRDPLGFEFITLPAEGSNPSLTISRTPYVDADFLSVWFWLLAKRDPAVTLVSGAVKAVGGPYDGQTLASGTTTTAAGRAFLWARLNVREATAGEVTRARGSGSKWNPRYSVGPSDYPKKINEFGFDTEATDPSGFTLNYSVVPL